jgi:2-isopropylmalate synthase
VVEERILDVIANWQLENRHTTTDTGMLRTATVSIRRPDGVLINDAAIGDGPVDSIFKAVVERATEITANLREFAVRDIAVGKDGQGAVSLELEAESDDRTFRGRAAPTEIIEGSAGAAPTSAPGATSAAIVAR